MTPSESVGLWTTCTGESLHDSLAGTIRMCRKRRPAPCIRFLPGTQFTDGEHLYEVVYGVQGLGERPQGWVAAARTDYLDRPETAPERYCYSLFNWEGVARDGVIIAGKRRPVILRMVAAAPRLEVV